MAEGRMLKKAISKSRRLAELKTDSARMLYTWIIPHLDVEGRFYTDPAIIKGSVVPRLKDFTEDKIAECLADMATVGLITLYTVDGDRYFHLRKFEDHQTLNPKREAPSRLPSPEQVRSKSGVDPDQLPSTPGELQGKLREVKLREVKLSKEAEHLPVDNSEPSEEDTPPFDPPKSEPEKPKQPTQNETQKPTNTRGERWTEKQGADLEELMDDIKNRYGVRYHQQVYVFVQSNFNKGNPDGVLFSLRRLITDRLAGKSIPLPGKWLEAVLNGNGNHPGENGKFEAAESERIHEARKQEESRDVAKLISGIGRSM